MDSGSYNRDTSKSQSMYLIFTSSLTFLIQNNDAVYEEKDGKSNINQKTLSLDTSSINFDWYRTWGGIDGEFSEEIVIDSADNIYLGGFTYSFGSGSTDMCLIKYDSSGTKLWNQTWGGSSSDFCKGIAIDSLNDIYVAGTTDNFGENKE